MVFGSKINGDVNDNRPTNLLNIEQSAQTAGMLRLILEILQFSIKIITALRTNLRMTFDLGEGFPVSYGMSGCGSPLHFSLMNSFTHLH